MPKAPETIYLTSENVCHLVHELEGVRLKLRTLASWAASGLVVPSFRWDRRPRSPRLYTVRDASLVRLVVRLREAGISLQRIRLMFAKYGASRLARSKVIVDGHGHAVLRRPGSADTEIPSGQTRFDFGDVLEETREAAERVA